MWYSWLYITVGYLLSSKLKEQTEEILSVAMIERAYSDDTANDLGWHEL